MTTTVWVRTSFVGMHRWKDAPEEVAFLRSWHRHVFHVRLGVRVVGLNREVEFFTLKDRVAAYLTMMWCRTPFEASCEMIAADLLSYFGAVFVEVSEDGENGATVEGD